MRSIKSGLYPIAALLSCLFGVRVSAQGAETSRIQELAAQIPDSYFSEQFAAAKSALQSGNYDECLEKLAGLRLAKGARPDRTSLLEGICLEGAGKHEAAVSAFTRSLQTKPSNSDTLFFLSLSQNAAGVPLDKALQNIDEALWFGKNAWIKSAELFYQKGLLLSQKPDVVKAIESLSQTAAMDKNHVRGRLLLAQLQLDSGARGDAIRVLREGVAASAQNRELKLALAKSLLTAADRKLNHDDIEEAVRITAELNSTAGNGPVNKELAMTTIRALSAAGKVELAQAQLQATTAQFPAGDPDLLALKKQLEIEKSAIEAEQARAGNAVPVLH